MKNGGQEKKLCVAQGHAVSHWESWVWALGVPASLCIALRGMLACPGF